MGSKFKIYISCPMSVLRSKVDDYAKVILKLGADVDFWTRGTSYNTLALDRADAVVVLLGDNKWRRPLESIPEGTRSEIASAYARSIPIYIGYRNGNNDNAIYESQGISTGWFEGIAGTSGHLLKRIFNWEETTGKRKVEMVQAQCKKEEEEEFDPFDPMLNTPLIYGTPGIHTISTGSGITDMLKGFKDPFGVTALSNETYMEHIAKVFPKKVPVPKGWETTKSSVMDKLKSKNK